MSFIDALQLLADDPAAPLDVAEVALLLATDEYPDLDVGEFVSQIDQLASDVSGRLVGGLAGRTAALATYLFEEQGFHGNSRDYYDPRNSYLNDVLERKLGIPITLSVLAIAVGARAGLDIVGIGLPGHFIVKTVEDDAEVLIDPFNGGQILTRDACTALVEAVAGRETQLTPEAFAPMPLGLIAARMLTNLKGIYLQREDFQRAARIMERLVILVPDDAVQQRDLGVSLVRAKRPGAAIEHLQAYLATDPQGEDAELVRKVLQRAQAEVSRWN
jgi:regulator of sirC expression with transglutaminase-like and TPR domain